MRSLAVLLASTLFFAPPSSAQSKALAQGKTETVRAKLGSTVEVRLPLELREGFHVNSNTPADKTLIPLRVKWTDGLLGAVDVVYPKPVMETFRFSKDKLSVFTGKFEVLTKFKVAPTAPPGPMAINGEVRYQACNDRGCEFPTTLKVSVQVMLVR
jgi:DsbC/DsbD-like thiol-disulfide interchange protein